MSDTFIASGAMRWSADHSLTRDREDFSSVVDRCYFRLSRRGHLARLHLIEPPPGSPRAIDSARERGRIRGWFTARKLGLSPATIVASRTRAENGVRSPWAPK